MKVLANTDADIRITVLCKSLEPCLITLDFALKISATF